MSLSSPPPSPPQTHTHTNLRFSCVTFNSKMKGMSSAAALLAVISSGSNSFLPESRDTYVSLLAPTLRNDSKRATK